MGMLYPTLLSLLMLLKYYIFFKKSIYIFEMFYNKNGHWVEIDSFSIEDNRFYINGEKVSGMTQIKDICVVCGKEFTINKLYRFDPALHTCGVCKRKKTNIQKYGVDNPAKNKKIKTKIGKASSINNKKEEVRNKYKQTMLRKYGVEHNSKSKNLQKKKKEKYKEKYGVQHHMQIEEIKNKMIESNKKIALEALQKRKQTNNRKFGVDWVFQSKEINKKKIKTHKENYGVEYPAQNKETLKKQEETKIKKYGNKNNYKKFKETCLKYYGVENPIQSKKIRNKIIETQRKNFYDNLDKFNNVKPIFEEENYIGTVYGYKWQCMLCDTYFYSDLLNGKTPRCPTCFPKFTGYSLLEKEIVDWLQHLHIEVKENDRELIKPKELDIYLPDYKLAIEFNGLYWHSTIYITDKWHHQKKIELCYRKGVRLLYIWEDEWLYDQNRVKEKILYYIRNIHSFIKIQRPVLIRKNEYLIWY